MTLFWLWVSVGCALSALIGFSTVRLGARKFGTDAWGAPESARERSASPAERAPEVVATASPLVERPVRPAVTRTRPVTAKQTTAKQTPRKRAQPKTARPKTPSRYRSPRLLDRTPRNSPSGLVRSRQGNARCRSRPTAAASPGIAHASMATRAGSSTSATCAATTCRATIRAEGRFEGRALVASCQARVRPRRLRPRRRLRSRSPSSRRRPSPMRWPPRAQEPL